MQEAAAPSADPTWDPGRHGGSLCCGLAHPHALSARALLAGLDVEGDLLATAESVEAHRGLQTVPMEEVLLAVVSRDEAEAPIGHDLLDGASCHVDSFSRNTLADRADCFENKESLTAATAS